MADHAVGDTGARQITPHAAAPAVYRKCSCSGSAEKCAACKEDEEGTVHRKATGGLTPSVAPPIVHSVVGNGGQPLDAATRAFMEPRFGFDFSRVRIHTDAHAAQSANAIQALAYTVNHSIVFSAGSYAPQTKTGRRLLAHELAHVVQQGAAPTQIQGKLAVGSVNDAAEADAKRSAEAAVSGDRTVNYHPRLSSGAIVRRAPATAETDAWTTQQDIGEIRTAKPPLVFVKDNHKVTVDITRKFKRCNFAKTDDKRSAWFYNPSASQLEIDRRVCKGSVVMDAFLKEISTAGAKGVEAGVAVNVAGDNTQGRVEVGAVGQEKNNVGGVGGRVEGSLKTHGVDLNVTGTYVRDILNKVAGANPNEVDVSAGVGVGDKTITVTGTDLAGKPQVTGNVGGTWDKPETTQCSVCYEPAPTPVFECSESLHTEPNTPEVPKNEPQREPKTFTPEYRLYFAWDSSDKPSEEQYLRTASDSNIKKMKDDLAKPDYPGYRVTSIRGFASPEGLERRINKPLAQKRAEALAKIVKDAVKGLAGKGAWHGLDSLPEPMGASELLGSNPAPPSAHLRDVIAASGKHSAEEISALLTGSEILPAQMTAEFLDLFKHTTPDEWMQLFGLGADSPARSEVESAVNAFIASDGKGPRPWEHVFRPLRFASVTLEGTEMVPVPKKEGDKRPDVATRSDVGPVNIDEKGRCEMYGEKAEREGNFGPAIDPSLLESQTFVIHGKEGCPTVPGGGNGKTSGCDYDIHEKSNRTPPAPKSAPKQL